MIFIIPIICNEKKIIINPATTLSSLEFFKTNCPKKVAAAPNDIKTIEKPKVKNNNGVILIFLFSKISSSEFHEMKEIYPGTNGKTQGDKKLIKPAPKAIK